MLLTESAVFSVEISGPKVVENCRCIPGGWGPFGGPGLASWMIGPCKARLAYCSVDVLGTRLCGCGFDSPAYIANFNYICSRVSFVSESERHCAIL